MNVLTLSDVSVSYGSFKAVSDVSLSLNAGETLAIVGESGCGKSTLARTILGLHAYEGEIVLQGGLVKGVARNQAEKVGVVWQDPFASLDPRWRVKDLVAEPAAVVGKKVDTAAILERVGLDARYADRYPHQLSGGQRQRVAIARAIALEPPLVICDEPTSALDLSIQAQILNLLKELQVATRCAYLYISHDLATVLHMSTQIAVMYLGRIVEFGSTSDIFKNPQHPYTRLLLESALTSTSIGHLPDAEVIQEVLGSGNGCPFAPRCPLVSEKCHNVLPLLENGVACHHALVGTKNSR